MKHRLCKISISIALCLLLVPLILLSWPQSELEWQNALQQRSIGVAVKTIYPTEIDPEVSNQHEFNGTKPFQQLLGQKRFTTHAKIVYQTDKKQVVSESFATWYDALEGNTKYDESRWRLYYPETRSISYAKARDTLLVARMKDETLLFIIAPPKSMAAKWIHQTYGQDKRLKTLSPPALRDYGTISLPQSFTQAKKILERNIYNEIFQRKTFYCGCDYSKNGEVDPLSCGYKPKRPNSRRSKRIEWEHIVPASYIGKGRMCWEQGHKECITRSGKTYKGRRCCKKVDKQFRRVEADLNNLVPAIGELNMDRSNYRHHEIEGEDRTYGACDFEVNRKLKEAEPAVNLRGFIGRTWIYMHYTHKVPVPEADLTIYKAWAEAYPPEPWEIMRRKRIESTVNE